MAYLYTYSPDIDGPILTALLQVLTSELQTQVISSDKLYLRTIKINPLQDDPTLTAPYVTIGPNFDKGIIKIEGGELEKEFGSTEIGGPVRFLYHYSITCGTPIVTTRAQCSSDIGNFTTRIAEILIRHYDLSSILSTGLIVSDDGSKWIEGANNRLVEIIDRQLNGGEQQWFGKGTINFHYPVSWDV